MQRSQGPKLGLSAPASARRATRCARVRRRVALARPLEASPPIAYIVTHGGTDALADRLNLLLEDRDLRMSFGRAGRRHMEREFDRGPLALRLDEIYASLL